MTVPALDAQGLGYRYANGRGVEHLHLQLARGDILGLLGLNGAGKSTALRLLAGTLRPATGRVVIDGVSATEHPLQARRRMGFLPERPPLYRELTVEEHLALAGRLQGLAGARLRTAAAAVLERCGLGECRRRLVGALSQGYRQRLGIAQTLIHRPALLLLDEPTVGLDPAQIHSLRALVRDLGGECAVVLSSHILPEVAAVCTRVALLHHGRLVHQQALGGPAADVVLRIRLQQPPAAAELAAVPGVETVEPMDSGQYLVTVRAATVIEALVQRAASQGWGLRELAPRADALEEVFLRLTRGDVQEPAA